MKAFLRSFTSLSLLSTSVLSFADEVVVPTVNKGDTAWVMISTILVILMIIPGLALFYGGMVRTKNMLSILMQVFVIFSMIAILWVAYGYSVAFTEGNAFLVALVKHF